MSALRIAVVGTKSRIVHDIVSTLHLRPSIYLALGALNVADIPSDFRPHVVLLDAVHCHEKVPIAVQAMLQKAPTTRILLIGVDDSEGTLLEAFEAGAIGYLSDFNSIERLQPAIAAVASGEAFCSARFVAMGADRLQKRSRELLHSRLKAESGLSFREIGVLELVSSGLSNQEVASSLNLSLHTVKNHVHRLLTKLRVRSRDDLIMYFG